MPEATPRNIYQRMNAVMADVVGVGKTSYNKQGRYNYAGHEAVTAALRDAYVRHGIVRTAHVLHDEREGGLLRMRVEVRWANVDDPSDSVSVVMVGESPPVTSSGVASAVQSGIALSYAVKNAEFKAFALTGDDTPDAEETDDGAARPPTSTGEGVSDSVYRAMLTMLETAATKEQLDQVRARVREHVSQLSPDQTKSLAAARDAAASRLAQAQPKQASDE